MLALVLSVGATMGLAAVGLSPVFVGLFAIVGMLAPPIWLVATNRRRSRAAMAALARALAAHLPVREARVELEPEATTEATAEAEATEEAELEVEAPRGRSRGLS